MNTENVKNELENGGWQEEAKQTINNREKMNELKNKFLSNHMENGPCILKPTRTVFRYIFKRFTLYLPLPL